MKREQPGLIEPGLWCLGRRESNVYLLKGDRDTILISGGMSYILPDVLEQMASFGVDATQITKILILHAHFDHIGIIPYLKRKNPSIDICASPRGWEILKKEKAITTINEFSKLTSKHMGLEKVLKDYDCEWRHDVSGETVKDGDTIDLGGRTVRILETPGIPPVPLRHMFLKSRRCFLQTAAASLPEAESVPRATPTTLFTSKASINWLSWRSKFSAPTITVT